MAEAANGGAAELATTALITQNINHSRSRTAKNDVL